jgi:hypothetical protein
LDNDKDDATDALSSSIYVEESGEEEGMTISFVNKDDAEDSLSRGAMSTVLCWDDNDGYDNDDDVKNLCFDMLMNQTTNMSLFPCQLMNFSFVCEHTLYPNKIPLILFCALFIVLRLRTRGVGFHRDIAQAQCRSRFSLGFLV